MSAECLASLLSTEEACPLSLVVFYYLGSFSGISSPSLAISFSFLFFFKFGMGSKSTMEGGKGGGSAGGSWDLKASLGPASYPLRGCAILFFFFFFLYSGISSSSSRSLSTHVTTRWRDWVIECLSSSSWKFGRWIISSPCSSLSSSRWNWS